MERILFVDDEAKLLERILFVDDEAKLLGGLRRMLHGLRREWFMEFAESGTAALDQLDHQPFDVIVTDMRMPGMDGSELLRRVAEQFPGLVRIVLSGQCDRLEVLKAVGPAHQFLTKPCDSETLKAALGRACRLRDRMTAPGPKELVSRVESVPCLPESLAALENACTTAAGADERIGPIIASEPGIAARVLQLVNSGFFGSPRKTVDPTHAAKLLGQERLRELVESSSAFSSPPLVEPLRGFAADTIEHSRAVAAAAGRIAELESDDAQLIANARWGGLLHDVGLLAFIQQSPDRLADLWGESAAQAASVVERERQVFDADHAAVGAYLLALWGLPDSLVEITALHHTPCESTDREFSALTAVHAAGIAHEINTPTQYIGDNTRFLG
ncbi:MAG: HDOD domain-containing protein, partial [Patescibacteria group bacterium]|nr:HDOD domain-containing protein [Patescibacteria group bacterium]